MMKRKIFLSIIIATAISGFLAVQNCNGTRIREDDLNVSLDQVDSQLQQLAGAQSTTGLSTNTNLSQAVANFMTLRNSADATLYYAEAPGSMGSLQNVAPMTLAPFFPSVDPTQIPEPTKLQIYFVFTNDVNGPRAGLILQGSFVAQVPPAPPGTAPDPSPSPATSGFVQNLAAKKLDATGTIGQGFVFAALNDGSEGTPDVNLASPLPAVEFGDTDVWVDLNYNDSVHLAMHSWDVVNGDLADTLQFEVYQELNGQNYYMGVINLTQPL